MNEQPKIILTLPSGEVRKYSVQMDSIRIGRAADNTVVIEDGSLSSHHAVLHRRESGYELLDLGSTNGIEYLGQRVLSQDLKHGQELKIGGVAMRFEWPGQPGIEGSAPPQAEEMKQDPESSEGGADKEKQKDEEKGKPKEDDEEQGGGRSAPLPGKGCMASIAVFLITLLAPVVGLHLRHLKETGHVLVLDMLHHPDAPAAQVPATP